MSLDYGFGTMTATTVGIGPTACLHRYLQLIIAGTNTALYLMVLLPIQLYEYH